MRDLLDPTHHQRLSHSPPTKLGRQDLSPNGKLRPLGFFRECFCNVQKASLRFCLGGLISEKNGSISPVGDDSHMQPEQGRDNKSVV